MAVGGVVGGLCAEGSGGGGATTAAVVIILGPQLTCLRGCSTAAVDVTVDFPIDLRRLVSICATVLYCRLNVDDHLARGESECPFSFGANVVVEFEFVDRLVGISARNLLPFRGVRFVSDLLLIQSIRSIMNGRGVSMSGPFESLPFSIELL